MINESSSAKFFFCALSMTTSHLQLQFVTPIVNYTYTKKLSKEKTIEVIIPADFYIIYTMVKYRLVFHL